MSKDKQSEKKTNDLNPPEWMPRADETQREIAYYEPEIAVEISRRIGAFPYALQIDREKNVIDPSEDENSYLYFFVEALLFSEVHTMGDWRQVVGSYPPAVSIKKKSSKRLPEKLKVRAHYLRQALPKLLRIIGAPEAMAQDIETILAYHQPREAKARARKQAAMSELPGRAPREGAGVREIARDLKCDPGQINKDVKAAKLVVPKRPDLSGGVKYVDALEDWEKDI